MFNFVAPVCKCKCLLEDPLAIFQVKIKYLFNTRGFSIKLDWFRFTGSYFNPLDVPPNPSSGPPSSSGHVTFSSDTSYGFAASIFRHNSGQDNKQRSKLIHRYQFLKISYLFFFYNTIKVSDASGNSVDPDDPHYASPKANKRLSFKHTSRKISAFGNPDSWKCHQWSDIPHLSTYYNSIYAICQMLQHFPVHVFHHLINNI